MLDSGVRRRRSCVSAAWSARCASCVGTGGGTAHRRRRTSSVSPARATGGTSFLVSVGSFHTFLIAVRASGESRKYVKIEDGGAVRKYDAELNAYFDYYGAQYGAATRFWPVYAAPAPFASEPAAVSVADDDEPVILE
jgi:hypothetical protein